MTVLSNAKIAQQIEQSADYYTPNTYTGMGGTAASYLTFYNEISLNYDSLGDQFIPLSTVAQNGRNPKMFVIGVIPPTANVTGRILDRSASINTVSPSDPLLTTVQTPSGDVTIVNPVTTTAPKQVVPNRLTKYSASQVKEAFYEAFIQVTGQAPTDQVLALLLAQSSFETRGWRSMHNNNMGNIRPGSNWNHQTTSFACSEVINKEEIHYPEGHPKAFFRAYPTLVEGSADYIAVLLRDNPKRNPPDAWKQALLSGDPETFSTLLKNPPPYYTASVDLYTKNMKRLYDKYLELDPVAPDARSGDWQSNGSKQADLSNQVQDKTATSDLVDVTTTLYTNAQKAQILETQKLLEALQNIPPLRLLVNPSSFSVKGERIVSESGWARNGNTIVEHWGTQQEKISASGKVAGFYALDAFNAVGPGLTRTARNYSQSWQNFQSLLMLYKNNGGIYMRDPVTSSASNTLAMVGSVYIYYDSIMYIGSFDSLRIAESDASPHSIEYSFEFSVRAAFLLDNPNPNEGTRPTTPINDQSVSQLF